MACVSRAERSVGLRTEALRAEAKHVGCTQPAQQAVPLYRMNSRQNRVSLVLAPDALRPRITYYQGVPVDFDDSCLVRG
jgi:hypothetical protein